MSDSKNKITTAEALHRDIPKLTGIIKNAGTFFTRLNEICPGHRAIEEGALTAGNGLNPLSKALRISDDAFTKKIELSKVQAISVNGKLRLANDVINNLVNALNSAISDGHISKRISVDGKSVLVMQQELNQASVTLKALFRNLDDCVGYKQGSTTPSGSGQRGRG